MGIRARDGHVGKRAGRQLAATRDANRAVDFRRIRDRTRDRKYQQTIEHV